MIVVAMMLLVRDQVIQSIRTSSNSYLIAKKNARLRRAVLKLHFIPRGAAHDRNKHVDWYLCFLAASSVPLSYSR